MWSAYFNPRAPRGARPVVYVSASSSGRFQSTRPSRGATQRIFVAGHQRPISIHAPLAGRDYPAFLAASWMAYFNPRAPRGARHDGLLGSLPSAVFQSTRPSRGATLIVPHLSGAGRNFNPRAPRGARHCVTAGCSVYFTFQSTRPSRGATASLRICCVRPTFQSTRPSRGATCRAA